MSHLSTERLAALGDEEPTAAEAAHLAACADCAREHSAYRTLVAMARTEREAIGIPLTRWESIAGALAAEPSTAMRIPVEHGRASAARGRGVRFTAMRCAHVPNWASPRKLGSARKIWIHTS